MKTKLTNSRENLSALKPPLVARFIATHWLPITFAVAIAIPAGFAAIMTATILSRPAPAAQPIIVHFPAPAKSVPTPAKNVLRTPDFENYNTGLRRWEGGSVVPNTRTEGGIKLETIALKTPATVKSILGSPVKTEFYINVYPRMTYKNGFEITYIKGRADWFYLPNARMEQVDFTNVEVPILAMDSNAKTPNSPKYVLVRVRTLIDQIDPR